MLLALFAFLLFETQSHYAAQASLELEIEIPLPELLTIPLQESPGCHASMITVAGEGEGGKPHTG
jgi:hypothetical protein